MMALPDTEEVPVRIRTRRRRQRVNDPVIAKPDEPIDDSEVPDRAKSFDGDDDPEYNDENTSQSKRVRKRRNTKVRQNANEEEEAAAEDEGEKQEEEPEEESEDDTSTTTTTTVTEVEATTEKATTEDDVEEEEEAAPPPPSKPPKKLRGKRISPPLSRSKRSSSLTHPPKSQDTNANDDEDSEEATLEFDQAVDNNLLLSPPEAEPRRLPPLYKDDIPKWYHWFEIFPAKILSKRRQIPITAEQQAWPPQSSPYVVQESTFHPSRIVTNPELAVTCPATDSHRILIIILLILVAFLSVAVCGLVAALQRRRRCVPQPPSEPPMDMMSDSYAATHHRETIIISSPPSPGPPGSRDCISFAPKLPSAFRFDRRKSRRRHRRHASADNCIAIEEVPGSPDSRCNSLPCGCLSNLVTPLMPQASAPPIEVGPIICPVPTAVSEAPSPRVEPPRRPSLCVGEELELLRPPLKEEVVNRWEKSYTNEETKKFKEDLKRSPTPELRQENNPTASSYHSRILRDVSSSAEFKTPRETASETEQSARSHITPQLLTTYKRRLRPAMSPCLSGVGGSTSSSSGPMAASSALDTPCDRVPRYACDDLFCRGRPPLPSRRPMRRQGRAMTDDFRRDVTRAPSGPNSQMPSPPPRQRRVNRRRAMTDDTPMLHGSRRMAHADLAKVLKVVNPNGRHRLQRSLDKIRGRRRAPSRVELDVTPRPCRQSTPERRRPQRPSSAAPPRSGLCCMWGDRVYRLRRSSSLEHDYLCDDDLSDSDESSTLSQNYEMDTEGVLYSSTLGDSDSFFHYGRVLTTGPESSSTSDEIDFLPTPSHHPSYTRSRHRRNPCVMRVIHFDTPRPVHYKQQKP
eukprot:Blabericola_migrator_1__411@NODE_10_length_25093_cov_104_131184_g7_i2_p1_GENE_NODE_10_length_25093_cov_104_131184_g7_i2NODE_10_length_25093_cov_104_131184_g7_i2_p1_ORF_typecomplete_len856_score121_97TMEM52/PF14979_6/6_2e03TMEM52/PF14979_6/0_7TMEM52/PF14979_6/5e03TMEM154/PF15102_6/1_8e04TMEM154/PF15102_6/3_9e03TMEM154/PF15102_6/0_88TMEM154/PF15102_6/1_8e04DNA_pol_phi/PF04931_13/7_1_NODE_10_length_25093_cov_104_131184_g7_i22208724654